MLENFDSLQKGLCEKFYLGSLLSERVDQSDYVSEDITCDSIVAHCSDSIEDNEGRIESFFGNLEDFRPRALHIPNRLNEAAKLQTLIEAESLSDIVAGELQHLVIELEKLKDNIGRSHRVEAMISGRLSRPFSIPEASYQKTSFCVRLTITKMSSDVQRF